MIIAISSTGNDLSSKLDQRFGRCSYFVFYDTESGDTRFVPNPNAGGREGVGPASVQFVASYGVKKIISGEFGIKIKPLLDSLQIQMIILKEADKTIKEVIEMINK